MKKISFLMFLLVCTTFSLYADMLNYDEGGKITKRMKLDIKAVIDSNAFMQWELKGDWDKFEYGFTQGNLDKKAKTFTIYAKDYLKSVNGEEGILLTITGLKKTKSGDYNLTMELAKATENLEVKNKDRMDLHLTINYVGHKKTIMEILLPFIIALVVILLILFVLHVTAKFPKGILQLGHNEVRLKGKKRISVKDELAKMNISLPDGTDVVFVKKRFASFQGPCIKETKNCNLNCYGYSLSKGSVIRHDEEIKGLTSSDGKEIIIRYCI